MQVIPEGESARQLAPAPAPIPAEVPGSHEPLRAARARQLAIGVLLFTGSLALYLANGRTVSFAVAGDSMPNRLIPFSILHYGTLSMDPFAKPFADRGGYRWYVQERRGQLVSYYPVGTPVAALPFYLPMYVWLRATGRTSPEELFAFSEQAEKLTASAMTALAVALIWLAVKRRTTLARASWTALVVATCSLLWPVASQVLWQHTVTALLLAAAILWTTPPGEPRQPFLLGLLFGICFTVRPQTALFSLGAALGLALAYRQQRFSSWLWRMVGFGLGVVIPAIPFVAYNHHYYGNWFGGYVMATGLFSGAHLLEGMSGLLLSPNRGLFVLMPVALLGVVGGWRLLHQPSRDPVLAGLLVGAVLYFVVHASTATWAGGWTFGPRYLTEAIPVLAVCSIWSLQKRRPAIAVLTGFAIGWSFLVQLSGGWFYPASNWNGRMDPHLERAAWDGSHFGPYEDFKAWRMRRQANP